MLFHFLGEERPWRNDKELLGIQERIRKEIGNNSGLVVTHEFEVEAQFGYCILRVCLNLKPFFFNFIWAFPLLCLCLATSAR